jgi:Fe-S oxidoreductase
MNKDNEIELTKMDWIEEQRTTCITNTNWTCHENVYLYHDNLTSKLYRCVCMYVCMYACMSMIDIEHLKSRLFQRFLLKIALKIFAKLKQLSWQGGFLERGGGF